MHGLHLQSYLLERVFVQCRVSVGRCVKKFAQEIDAVRFNIGLGKCRNGMLNGGLEQWV